MIVEGDHPKPSPLKAVVQGALVPTHGQPIVLLWNAVTSIMWVKDAARVVLQRTWIFAQVELSGQYALVPSTVHHITAEIFSPLPVWIATPLRSIFSAATFVFCWERRHSHGNME